MSELHGLRGSSRPGPQEAARLLRAIGSEAGPIWAQLTQRETAAITAQMNRLPSDNQVSDKAALEAFLLETGPGGPGSAARDAQPLSGVWASLTNNHAPLLAALVHQESPQVAAWIMTQLEPKLAAHVVRMLDEETSLAILKRLMDLRALPKPVAELIEASLADTLARIGPDANLDGHARVARIVDQLDHDREKSLMEGLAASDPGAAERIRALMFTFEDLAVLSPAGMQTLLAHVDRTVLTMALKGGRLELTNAFFSNLTRRAGALIREEMVALGQVRRSQVEAARQEIVEIARRLLRQGDISTDHGADDDELVE